MTRLKNFRKKQGLKLREVAKIIGVTPQTVHDAEERGILTPRLALKYASALGCNWMELLEPPKQSN